HGAIEGLNFGGADIDPAHQPFLGADDDPVTDTDRALPKKDEAGDKIIDNRLQAEADTDRQGAGDNRQFLEIQPQIGKRKAERQKEAEIAEARPDGVAQAEIEPCKRQEAAFDPAPY